MDDAEETPSQNWTHFGYVKVLADEKAGKVAQVFESVARRYDLMNDLMTWGLHRHWKRSAVKLSGVRSGDRVLDLAGGTGDLALRLARRVGAEGSVVLAYITPRLLYEAQRR